MSRVPLRPPGARQFNTVCQFCIVGCGYRVYKWPLGQEGGPNPRKMPAGRFHPPAAGFRRLDFPNMHSVVSDRDGSRHRVVIIPVPTAG